MSGKPLRYAVVGKKKVLARRRAVVVECLGKLGIRMDAAGKGTPKQRIPPKAQHPPCGCSARREFCGVVAQAVHGFERERRDERAEGERLCRDCLRSAHSQVFVGGVERSLACGLVRLAFSFCGGWWPGRQRGTRRREGGRLRVRDEGGQGGLSKGLAVGVCLLLGGRAFIFLGLMGEQDWLGGWLRPSRCQRSLLASVWGF